MALLGYGLDEIDHVLGVGLLEGHREQNDGVVKPNELMALLASRQRSLRASPQRPAFR
jgi:hypothetical protein